MNTLSTFGWWGVHEKVDGLIITLTLNGEVTSYQETENFCVCTYKTITYLLPEAFNYVILHREEGSSFMLLAFLFYFKGNSGLPQCVDR